MIILHCKDCSELIPDIDWDSLNLEFVTCPSCGAKYTVEYDEYYDEYTQEEDSQWWLEPYIDPL